MNENRLSNAVSEGLDRAYRQTVGWRIRQARLKKKLKQHELAEQLGRSHSTVSSWESGRQTPKLELLKKLAGILDLDENWLLSGERHGLEPKSAATTAREPSTDFGTMGRSEQEVGEGRLYMRFAGILPATKVRLDVGPGGVWLELGPMIKVRIEYKDALQLARAFAKEYEILEDLVATDFGPDGNTDVDHS